jgi:translocation and assembly module TamB
MGHAARWSLRILALLLGLSLCLIVLLLGGANTQPGRDLIESSIGRVTGGEVGIAGLSGRFPDALRIRRVELRDGAGLWLAVENLVLDWSPSALLAGLVDVDRLTADHVALDRLPAASDDTSSSPAPSLPVRITLRALQVYRLDVAPGVFGSAVAVAIGGNAHLASPQRGDADLSMRQLDGTGAYALQGSIDPAGLRAHVTVQEPPGGPLSAAAGLPDLGALSMVTALEGPWSGVQTRLELAAGPLRAEARGTLDLEHRAADLSVTATAPAVEPRPDLSWRALVLNAQVHGPLTRMKADGTLHIDALNIAGAAARRIAADVRGDAGVVRLRAELDGLRIPGPRPDLLEAVPLVIEGDARLDAPDRPVKFTLRHSLIAADGKARTAGEPQGELVLSLPDLAPFAAAAGVVLKGRAVLQLRAALQDEITRLDLDGDLAVTGGAAPWPAVVGDRGKIGASLALRGRDFDLSRLTFDGRALHLSAEGGLMGQSLDLSWKLALSDLAALTPTLTGRISTEGHLSGLVGRLALAADLKGEMAAAGMPSGPVNARLRLQGLPAGVSGELTGRGVLDRSSLDLALALKRGEDGTLRVDIRSAQWKSAYAQGAVALPKGALLPEGRLDLRMARLEDLQPLLGQPLSGSIAAHVETTERLARLQLDVRNASVTGTASVEHARLTATVSDPRNRPWVEGRLALERIAHGTAAGSASLEIAGRPEALDLKVHTQVQNLAGADGRLSATAVIDGKARIARVSTLQANWKGETLRLLAPVRIGFAEGLTVDRLRLGLRQAAFEAAGRAAPTLDLKVVLRRLPVDLAGLFVPGYAADGMLQADARLSGTPRRPGGSVRLELKGLHLRNGPGRALPPANLTASADLAGESARIEGRLSADSTRLTLTGRVPFSASGPMDLRADGSANLALLEPLLQAGGRRVRGRLTLHASASGSAAEPRLTGTAELADGEVQDYVQGAHISNLAALLQADDGTIRIVRMEGRAGSGTIAATGRIGLLTPGIPVDLTLIARRARPLASDRLTVTLDANVTIRGQSARGLAAAGNLHVRRAEIRIPEHMPASIAVLDVRRPGADPPPPPAPGPDLDLDLTIEAPDEIFVRGRGLDAELGGKVQVRGTAASPQADGGFQMRRGQFSLAGQTLIFNKGEVGFTGGSLTDPVLDFVAAATSGNITATFAVAGTARKPKIMLSSVPELPQDEVLARLLFGRGTSSLSPFELAQIAVAVASLTGVTAGGDPLEGVRKRLGLDRLSIVGGQGGSPSLEAGRYVAPGVYVGTKQGVSGTGTQATVQIDIARGLKLEGNVGTGPPSGAAGSGTNSIGVTYQFEY